MSSSNSNNRKPDYRITLYYDIVSPYTYLACNILLRYVQYWNIELVFKPIYQGAIMSLANNKPPGLVPNKAAYLTRDLTYLSRYYNIPLVMPENFLEFMYNSLGPMRLITAVAMHFPNKLIDFSMEMFKFVFSDNQNVLDKSIQVIALNNVGINNTNDHQLLLHCTSSEQVKSLLKKNTDEAYKIGGFGVPTYVITNLNDKNMKEEDNNIMLFGSDRFHIAAMIMGKQWNGPYPHNNTAITSKL